MDQALTAIIGVVLGAVTTGSIGYWAALKPARMARDEAREDRKVAVEALEDQREDSAVTRITEAWELARSHDARERRVGLRMLRAMVQQPHLGPLAWAMLDEMVQEELGQPLAELRRVWERTGALPVVAPDVDIEIVVTDTDGWDEEVDDAQDEDRGHAPSS